MNCSQLFVYMHEKQIPRKSEFPSELFYKILQNFIQFYMGKRYKNL